jgi:hypothetical protein
LASKCKAMEQGIKTVLDLIGMEPEEALIDRPEAIRREVPKLLDLVQIIHPQCWRVHDRPRVRHGAVTLP